MKITCRQSTLVEKLDLVGKIATKHVTLPVLQCVLIDATVERVVLKATNLEIAAEVTVPDVVVEEAGTVAVPAAVLVQIIQQLKNDSVTLIKNEQGVLEVVTKHTATTINPIPHDEFPSIPKSSGGTTTINGKQFALGIKTTAVAASQSSIKPELGSVYIQQVKEHTLTFVATDSFRLMEKSVAQKGVSLEQSILIPQKNALELARFCELLKADPVLQMNENQCALQFDDQVYVTTRLVSGSFPDYNAIIPKEFSTYSTILKQDLVVALKKTNIFLNKFRQVRLSVRSTEMSISAHNNDIGTITDTISAQTTGDDLELSFNQQYLNDVLSYIQDDSLYLQFAGVGRPLIITGKNDNTLRYLVMPMNK